MSKNKAQVPAHDRKDQLNQTKQALDAALKANRRLTRANAGLLAALKKQRRRNGDLTTLLEAIKESRDSLVQQIRQDALKLALLNCEFAEADALASSWFEEHEARLREIQSLSGQISRLQNLPAPLSKIIEMCMELADDLQIPALREAFEVKLKDGDFWCMLEILANELRPFRKSQK